MILTKKRIIGFAVLCAMTGLISCAATTPPPPPNRVEVVAVRPYYQAAWVAGHWRWARWRHVWVWVPGHWRRY